jgi:hypothetical protein
MTGFRRSLALALDPPSIGAIQAATARRRPRRPRTTPDASSPLTGEKRGSEGLFDLSCAHARASACAGAPEAKEKRGESFSFFLIWIRIRRQAHSYADADHASSARGRARTRLAREEIRLLRSGFSPIFLR